MKPAILIIDDEEIIRKFLKIPLDKRGYRVFLASSGREGLTAYRKEDPDIVILDMRLPDSDGLDILKEIMEEDPSKIVVMITAYAEVELAVRAMKLGAFDYISKPFEFAEINLIVEKASALLKLRNKLSLLERFWDKYIYADMVGKCKKMRDLFQSIEEIAVSPAKTIFIFGETGTGKELTARAVHNKSSRASSPFVAINCTILDERLLQSELFGHEKGAFTDASVTKKGLFEVADGGTIFLDEIGDMKPSLQVKLLRVLDEMSFRRLGGVKDIKVNLRVITSSNRNMKEEVAEKRFRDDLYYRINVVSLKIPPLRERDDDILLLVEHYLKKYNGEFGKQVRGFTPEASVLLLRYDWPGNVRELRNLLERLVLLSGVEMITPAHLPLEIRGGGVDRLSMLEKEDYTGLEFTEAKQRVVSGFEKKYIGDLLQQYQGNVSHAATAAGINRSTLQRMLKKYDLSSRNFT